MWRTSVAGHRPTGRRGLPDDAPTGRAERWMLPETPLRIADEEQLRSTTEDELAEALRDE